MNYVSADEKDQRADYLNAVAARSIEHTLQFITLELGIDHRATAARCLSVDPAKINATVDYYYDDLLHNYKKYNGYYKNERLSGRDKMAALTAIAILTFQPIRVTNYDGTSAAMAMTNENFALFFASIVLHVDHRKTLESQHVPVILTRNMLLNLRDLGITARARARQQNPMQSTESLADWVIQAMQLYALAYGKIDLRL
ncbi:hypothetical protein [Azospirillum sp. TSO22-1]|uniref:hypothetical protein n=1 Tax=Azospirillum sp. TSO22-1 TaxID=716789 RepID=UPI0011B7912F|nr:hypothetical protein [Azospirillum sp. TSO22-1]